MQFPRTSRLPVGLIALGIAISLLWVWGTGGPGSLASLWRVGAVYWAPLLGITAFHLLVRFVRWQFLLRRIGIRLPARSSLTAYLASLVGAATPAYAGEALRSVFVRRRHGVRVGATLTIIIIERLFDISALGIIGIVFADSLMKAAAFAILIFTAVAVVFGIVRLARHSAFPIEASILDMRPRLVIPALMLSIAAWGAAAAAPSVAAAALGMNLNISDGARIFSQSTLLGGLTLMPAGLGATGSAAVFQLQDLGYDSASAVPIVALFRLSTTGFALAIGAVFLMIELRARKAAAAPSAARHFDEIAMDYERQYAPHIWKLLLERKVGMLADTLVSEGKNNGLGLDFGCGLGQQAASMRERGWRVLGLDPSTHLLKNAARAGVPAVAGDGLALPFQNATFDFIYAIGVLHHLPDGNAQMSAVAEIARVLKPGGVFLVQETNTRNPLFVFYMGYVFPILKTIDEGTEQWIDPRRWESVPGLRVGATRYFTFLPDTVPRFLLGTLLKFERRLERSRLRPYAVHYMAVLRKDGAPDEPNKNRPADR